MLAAERGQRNVVDALISAGAYVNADDDSKKTALMNAAENGLRGRSKIFPESDRILIGR